VDEASILTSESGENILELGGFDKLAEHPAEGGCGAVSGDAVSSDE